jgi:general secretion pathway protein N
MRRGLGYTLLGAVAYLVFLAAGTPASQAHALLAPHLGALSTDVLQGTVWSGGARDVQFHGLRLNAVAWEVHPWALALGRVQLDVRFHTAGGKGSARLSGRRDGRIRAEGVDIELPLAEITSLLASLPLRVEGIVRIAASEIEIAEGIETLQGVVTVENALLHTDRALALGGFAAELRSTGQEILAELRDTGGVLQLRGSARIDAAGRYELDALVRPREGADPQIVQGLQFLGSARPDGGVNLRYAGQLGPPGQAAVAAIVKR